MNEIVSTLVDQELLALCEEVAWLRRRVQELEPGPLRYRALVSTAEGWELALPFATWGEAAREGRAWQDPALGEPLIEMLCPIRGWVPARCCVPNDGIDDYVSGT